MKIVCDSCGAKYSIADEKVAGKVFKIRCKKCSAVIVVRGDQVGNEAEAASQAAASLGGPGHEAPAQMPADAIWHVVIDGEQQGPYAMSQIMDMLSNGNIDWESYVWREGFEGWLAARDVPEVVEAATGSAEPAQSAPAANVGVAAAAAQDPYGEGATGHTPFQASATADAGGGLFGTESSGADLFAQSTMGASPFDGGAAHEAVPGSAAAPAAAAADQAMTGQRNENSVLFSLANLQALATGPDTNSAPASTASAPANSSGHATGEGSGLIDIRALASTTGTTGGPVSSRPSGGPKDNKVDDLLSIGTGSAFGSSLGAPVLAPVQEEKSNRMVIIGAAAVVGISVLAAAAVVAVVALRDPPEVATASQPAAITPPAGTTGAALTTGQPEVATDTTADSVDSEGDTPTDSPAAERSPSTRRANAADSSRRDRRGRGGRSQAGSSSRNTAAAAARTPAPEPATPTMMSARRGGDDIDSLLAAALGGNGSRMSSSPARMAASMGGGNLPETPPRDAVLRGLRSVSGPVRACGGGQHGVANTTVVIAGSTGRVQSARVAGSFAGTPVGSCVARAVRGARFPRFSRSSFSVTFPYSI